MLSFYKKYARTLFDIGLIVATVFIIMWLFSLFYKIAAPIFFAFVFFFIFEPLARFLNKKGIRKSIATALSMLIFATTFIVILVGGGLIFIKQIDTLMTKIPQYSTIIQNEIVKQTEYLQRQYDALPESWTEKIREYAGFIASKAAELIAWFLQALVGFVSSMSNFVINFLVGLILAYFLSVEIDQWKKIAQEKTPNTFKKAFFFLRDHVLKGIASYLKAQLKLITITFIIICVALLILGVKNAFAIALLAALFDLLPLLGVSTVFLPWIGYLLIVGNYKFAIILGILLIIVILFRQIFEPKIVGDSLGVSAFTMLSFMIISLSIFGVAGLILSPILVILIKELYVQGYLKQWIRPPEDY